MDGAPWACKPVHQDSVALQAAVEPTGEYLRRVFEGLPFYEDGVVKAWGGLSPTLQDFVQH